MRVLVNQLYASGVHEKLVKRVMAVAAKEDPQYRHAEVSVAFVSDAVSRRLNRQYRHIDRPTDVLSFSELDVKKAEMISTGYVGEIVIAVPYTRRQAKRLLHSFREEVIILLIHGWLHLIGHDHIRNAAAVKMQRLEKRILRAYLSNN
ncbi:MAG: rRNA maturation RNase YbeY [Patescibacteria group bacterium]|jgi:probable rRNA maturation factor